jgi:hypothetical protein
VVVGVGHVTQRQHIVHESHVPSQQTRMQFGGIDGALTDAGPRRWLPVRRPWARCLGPLFGPARRGVCRGVPELTGVQCSCWQATGVLPPRLEAADGMTRQRTS